jgi:hypothetical protein
VSIVLGFTPEDMGKGNWSVGLIADERATAGATQLSRSPAASQ